MMEYPWYELVDKSNEITQGDILKACPVPILSGISNIESYSDIDAKIDIIDGIVLTQACDIANNKVENIILCAITSKEDFEKSALESGKNPKEINKNIKKTRIMINLTIVKYTFELKFITNRRN